MVSLRSRKQGSQPAASIVSVDTQSQAAKQMQPPSAAQPKPLAVVTGGNGFLGRHIVQQLLESGEYTVRVFDIRPPASEAAITSVDYAVGDLRSVEDVVTACQGAAVVFHVATASPTGANAYNHALMKGVNVDGTRNVVEACVHAGIPALVYTSSASVVFDGRDLHDADESTPYAARPLDYYTKTKIEGEKLVLEANGRGGLATCALRPSGIFGEHDLLLVPTTVSKARVGKMKYIVGAGNNLNDWTYAGNVACAHLAAADALRREGLESKAAGKAYFVTNDDPKPFWGFLGDICEGLGYGRPHIHLPYALVLFIACFVQFVLVPLFGLFGRKLETDFTPFRMRVAAANRTFSCKAAKQDLGYEPKVNMEEGLRRTLAHFQHLKAHTDAEKKS